MSRKYIVTITGIDGAGKTTQAILLKRTISSRYGINVELIHFETPTPVAKLIDMLLSKMKRNSSSDVINSKKSRQALRHALYSLLYLFTGIIFYLKLLYILIVKSKGRRKLLVICDRYPLTDGLAHIMYRTQDLRFINLTLRLWHLFELIINVTANQIFVQFYINPNLAAIRRPEHDIKRLKLHQHVILLSCHKYKRRYCNVLDVDKPLIDVHEELFKLISRTLNE